MNKRLLVIAFILILALTSIVGCSGSKNDDNKSQAGNGNTNSTAETGQVTGEPAKDNSKNELVLNIMELAKQGKIINCEFPVKTTNLDDVESKWGKADNTAWVPAAKGTYSTYSKHNVAFGWNKGMQVFEVRSFDSQIKTVSLTDLTRSFGTPAYDVRADGQEIIGYKAGPEYKLLFVLAQTTDVNPNPPLDHYSVLYPAATVNSMADDPGRQW